MMVTGAIVYDWCYAVLTKEQADRFIARNCVSRKRWKPDIRLTTAAI